MIGIDEHGVYFAQQVPTPDKITVSVVNKDETYRSERIFDNTEDGEREAIAWTLDVDFTVQDYAADLADPEPSVAVG